MVRGKLLSGSEQARIVKSLAKGTSVTEIAKEVGRDTRTVKKYVAQPEKKYTRPKGPCKTSVTRREKTLLKRAMAKNPLASSKSTFEGAGVTPKGKTTRNKVLKEIGKVVKPRARPSLSKKHKTARFNWAKVFNRRERTVFSMMWNRNLR
ncbi:hypothetical protein FOL47_007287 [Perkinsus chesapeaki]|uniref:Transposase IS30-like HTH domain-containing protein n=1 Tax=Perkinsus chesapeaki TaxID=330153 RepID=A0A7J6LLN7_PERCH|nr:hypothetical protein FOL47_007287 [Perkinsus chesapeaki]